MKKSLFIFIQIILALTLISIDGLGQRNWKDKKLVTIEGRSLHLFFHATTNLKPAYSQFYKNRMASCASDSILLIRQSQIDSFPITNPTCTVLRKLIIDGTNASPAITNLDSLSLLNSITGNLVIKNTSLTSLSDMSGLTQIGDSLDLEYNASLTSIGLSGLTELGGIYFREMPTLTDISNLCDNIHITGNITIESTGITDFSTFKNIDSIVTGNGGLNIKNCPLISLSDFNSLHYINGYLNLNDNPSLSSIDIPDLNECWGFLFNDLPALSSLGSLSFNLTNHDIGTFWFFSTGLSDLSGMDSVHSSANFYIDFNGNITSLHGLEQLSGDNYGIEIGSNPNLSSIAALSNLTAVQDQSDINIFQNDVLTSLSGINNITLIDGGLSISQNPVLQDLSALKPSLVINNTNGDSVQIFENPLISVCNVPAICNYLSRDIGGAEIYNNAPGCNDTTEVIASCNNLNCTTQNLKTWNGNLSTDWDDDNNWTPFGFPTPCDSILIPSSAVLFPIIGRNVICSGLTMEDNTSLDLSDEFNLTVNGNFFMTNAQLNGNSGHLLLKNSESLINIENSTIEPYLTVQGYTCPLRIYNNTFKNDVSISDSTLKEGDDDLSGNTYQGNLTLTSNAYDEDVIKTLAEDNDAFIYGNLTLNNNSLADLESTNNLHINGDFKINSPFYSNYHISSIYFEGDGDSHFTKIQGIPETIDFLGVNKSSGNVILDQDVTINQGAELISGLVKTAPGKLLIFDNQGRNNSITKYSNKSYVLGPLKEKGFQHFAFPIGDSNTSSICEIVNPSNNYYSDEITAQYFHQNPSINGYDTSLHVSSLDSVSGKEYWKLTRNGGDSAVWISLFFDSTHSEPVSSIYNLRVAKWDGTKWLNTGGSDFSGNVSSAFVSPSFRDSANGIYTLGYAPFRKPVITVGQVDSSACVSHSIKIPYSTDTLTFNDNSFVAQLSDSSGNFFAPNSYPIGSINSDHSDTITASIPYYVKAANNYRIRIIGNSPPDTSINQALIKIVKAPSSTFSITGPLTGCIGNGIYKYYITTAETGVNYNWSLNGGGTYTTNNDTIYITWTTAGNYPISVNNSNACGAGGFTNLWVSVLPPAPSETPSINNIGRWLYSSIPDVNQNSLGYHWYRNDTLIDGASNSSYYVSSSGNYTVRYYNNCGESPVSNTVSFAANSLPQTITFPAIPDKNYGDSSFVPEATASSGLPVSFILISGPASLNPVTNLLTILGVGTVTLKATQQGDNIYDTAAPVIRTFTVNKASQTINFSNISDKDIYSTTSFSLIATSSSGLPVSFTLVSGPATINGSTVTLTGLGTVTIRASQIGDANYLVATDVDKSFCVNTSKLNPINGPNSICPLTNATYSVNNLPGATYTWYVAGGANLSSTSNSVTTQWASPGNYTLIVNAAGSCGAASIDDTLSIIALTSAEPDSVHDMLPANGAINQQLPLQLSWIPANPKLNYSFDIYLWRSDSVQPSTPYASDISTVNYIIPFTAKLSYNHTYNWMVVAHNGSCTQINTGPIQQFNLIPLPDLQVMNVLAPATAFSGQTVSVNWTVKNNGPGNTGAKAWTDAIFFSFDSLPDFKISPETNPVAWNQLQFPVRPLLIGTKTNVSSLDSGQQYSNSINFTLPVNYSSPFYVYVISNYPHSENAPLQTTYSNDTARAPQPIDVTLSPQPDLRVDTVFTPASTFTGTALNLTYKVKNYGVLTPSGNQWWDKIYISNSPFFDVNNATLLKFPKGNGSYYFNAPDAQLNQEVQLQQDSSYTVNTQVVIPNFLNAGTYYIYVFTNATKSLYEGPNTNNNVNYNLVQVFLTPTPVLTVSSLIIPTTTASTTQSLGINWNIKNAGFYDNIEKNKGHYGTYGTNCDIPIIACDQNGQNCHVVGSTPGHILKDSLGWGSSYWKDKVYLSSDTAFNVNNAIYIGPYLHGGDRNVALYAGYFNDYLSSPFNNCQANTVNPSNSGLNIQNVIYPGKDFPTNLNLTIPDTLSAGDYYVYIYANPDHEVFEYPGTPQIRRSSLAITIQRPDAVVNSINAPASAMGGQSISINYTVTNNGPGAVYNHIRNDKLFVSTSSVFDNTAVAVGTFIYNENLPVGIAVPHSINYTFPPATSGTKYIYIQTNYDSSFKETNSNNNISAAAAVSVTQANPADLTVSGITISDTVYTTYQQLLRYTVVNSGQSVNNGNWIDSMFISCVPTFNSSTAYYVAKRNHNNIGLFGNSYKDSFYISLPYSFNINNCFPRAQDDHAYFFVKTNANNGIFEGANTGNNISGSGQIDLRNPFPDHIVTTVSGPDTATVGRPYTVSWTVKNLGYYPGNNYYTDWTDYLYFSTDSVLNANAHFIKNYREISTLNTNQTYNDSQAPTIPVLSGGDYYVFVNTNASNSFIESNSTNNINLIRDNAGAAKKIHVIVPELPDLTDSILSAGNSVALGQPLTLIHQVTNAGSGITYPNTWVDKIWLSTDFVPGNGGDVLMYQKNHNGNLSPAQYYNDTITTNPVPYYLTPGNYILIVQTNGNGSVIESNSSNNLAFYYITVFSPVPVDLLVENIQHPDTAYLGNTINTANWVILNNAPNTAKGISTDGIYLSQNTTFDSTATLIGLVNKNINMAPLSKYTVVANPLVTGVVEGNYNLIVRTDILNNIIETDKSNNANVSSTPIYVAVKPLPLNVLTADSMQHTARYFKLRIPDSLIGATISVTLKSNDSLSVNNQLFIGDGYIPSAAHFDYEYNNPNYGNQQIVMSSVTDSVFYITVSCTTNNPPIQNITLKAEVLPFTIISVNANSGGNSGNVTVKISGSLFTNNMSAELTNTSTTIVASSVYFINSTTVYATFNLAGQALGIYDVKLNKTDLTTATLPNGFSIVAPDNGGLITGGGVNTGSGDGNQAGCDPGAAAGLNSQLSIELVLPEKAFGGWAFPIQINYNNPTNNDIPAQTRVLYSLDSLPVAYTQADLDGAGPTLYLLITEQNGPPGIIRAGGSGTIIVYSRAPVTFPAHKKARFTIK